MFRKGSLQDPQLEVVYNTAQKYEADLAREVLETNGIPALLKDREDSGEYLRILGYGSPFGFDILVRKDQAQEAKRLLEETFAADKNISDEELERLALQSAAEVIIASNNKGKIAEYKDILEPLGFEVFSQQEKGIALEVEETGETFAQNAMLKAQAIYDRTGCCVISDDSGLEVTALDGEPGIYSARYKGLESEHERRLAILEGLEGEEDRSARFVCCICLIEMDGTTHTFEGIWKGTIATEESGTNGFGYDPIFISEDSNGQTTASMPISFKETYSHRAKAVAKLMEYLKSR